MKTHTKAIHGILIGLAAFWFGESIASAAGFAPGEILLNNTYGHNVQAYSPTGTLLQTYSSPGDFGSYAAALTPDGNLAVERFVGGISGINIFNSAGSVIGGFDFSAFSPGFDDDVSVFANGTVSVTSNLPDSPVVGLFSPAGTLLHTVNLPVFLFPFGSTVGTDGVLYVANRIGGLIARISQAGTLLGTIPADFGPIDLVMSPTDGTLWVSGGGSVVHMLTDGTVLGSFGTGLTGNIGGIGLAPDDNSLYLSSTSLIRHFSLTGTSLGDFNLVSPNNGPQYLTVVPNAPGVPEPPTLLLMSLGFSMLTIAAGTRRRPRAEYPRIVGLSQAMVVVQ